MQFQRKLLHPIFQDTAAHMKPGKRAAHLRENLTNISKTIINEHGRNR